jgi:hypothetical protein
VKRCGLPLASRDFALEKVSLSCGQILTGGCTFGIGKKDTPIHISKAGYIDKLRWISQKYVVFWDETDKRGWMVDGSNALLHLLRGSLELSRTDKFCSQFLFDFAKLKDRDSLKHDSAIDVLLDPHHRRLPVYPAKEETHSETVTTTGGAIETVTKTKTTYKTLEDTVEELYGCLEKMIDHKAQLENPKGLNAKVRLRRYLEGWDFRDVVEHRDPFHLRVATLPGSAFSWVELTRSAQVVTLFGRGFGELLTPAAESNRAGCPVWRSVPRNKHYLCVSLANLQEIINDYGGDSIKHGISITPGLAWVNPLPKTPFGGCPCETAVGGAALQRSQHHTCPIQHLLPSKLHTLMKWGPLELDGCEEGAVIFGQGWTWPDSGEPSSEHTCSLSSHPSATTSSQQTVEASENSGTSTPSINGTSASRTSHSVSSPYTPDTHMSEIPALVVRYPVNITESPSGVLHLEKLMVPPSSVQSLSAPSAHPSPAPGEESNRAKFVQRASKLPLVQMLKGAIQ